jgi:hypothetical protein
MQPRRGDEVVHIPRVHQMRSRILNPRNTAIAHCNPKLILQDVDQLLDALLPIAGCVQKAPPNPDARCT